MVFVKDTLFLVILDTCRNRLNGSEIADSYSDTLDPKSRPAVSVLCTATSRSKKAWENPEVSADLSAFTHYITIEECGLFVPNVSVKMALELACQKLRQHPKSLNQEPTPIGLDRIQADICLIQHHLPATRYDVCMCYHENDVDLAHFVHDKLKAASNSPSIFFSAAKQDWNTGLKNEQISGAILHSRVVILIVSEKTFKDIPCAIDELEASGEGPLSHLLLMVERYGLFPQKEGGAVLPIYCGVEKDGNFKKSQPGTLWPSGTTLKGTVTSITAQARRLLRSDGLHMAKLMSIRNLPHIPLVASLVKGRYIADTLRVLTDVRQIELVGPRQNAGDYVSRLFVHLWSVVITGMMTLAVRERLEQVWEISARTVEWIHRV